MTHFVNNEQFFFIDECVYNFMATCDFLEIF